MDILTIGIPPSKGLGLPPNAQGDYPPQLVNWTGHVDRHGNIVSCSTTGVDCIPVTLQNVKTSTEYYHTDDGTRIPASNFDVLAPSGQTLIGYPN